MKAMYNHGLQKHMFPLKMSSFWACKCTRSHSINMEMCVHENANRAAEANRNEKKEVVASESACHTHII